MRKSVPHVCLLIAMLLWSSAFVGIRIGLQHYTPGGLALLRYLVASIMMLFYYFRPGYTITMCKKDFLPVLVLGCLEFTLYNIFLNDAERQINSTTASLLIAVSPVLVAVLAKFILKTRLGWLGVVGLAISLSGVAMINLSGGAHFMLNVGTIYAFLATLCIALYTILQKPLLSRIHAFELVPVAVWLGTLLLLPYAPQMWAGLQSADTYTTAWVIFIGIFPAGIAFALWGYALQKVDVNCVSSYAYLLPLFTFFIAYFYLHEVPTWIAAIGGLVALIGTLLVNISVRRCEVSAGGTETDAT